MNKKHIKQRLAIAFYFSSCMLVAVFAWNLIKTTRTLPNKTTETLHHSVKNYIYSESKDIPHLSQKKITQEQIGDFVNRTHIFPDTTIIFRTKVVDAETDMLRSYQTLLLFKDKLRPESVLLFFDSLLIENGIHHTQSVIGITSSSYKTINLWSGDTTDISISHRAVLDKQGNFEGINYYAYTNYSLLTYWKLMPWGTICILLSCALGITLLRWRTKERKPYYTHQLQNIFIDIDKGDMFTETGKAKVKLTKQQTQLLRLFLQSESKKVSKTAIKEELWSTTNSNVNNNMRVSINRLNDKLKNSECPYTIISVSEDINEYYWLTVPEEKTTRL